MTDVDGPSPTATPHGIETQPPGLSRGGPVLADGVARERFSTGLVSPSYKCTRERKRPAYAPSRPVDERGKVVPHVRFYGDGTLVQADTGRRAPPPVVPDDDYRCTATTKAGCRCTRKAHDDDLQGRCTVHAHGRKVTLYSKGSRRLLTRRLSMTDRRERLLFVTLTYPAAQAPTAGQWHNDLRRFGARFQRRWPRGSFFWRREFTKRGTVHLHLLAYGASRPAMLRWVSVAWAESCATGNPDHVKAGTNVEHVKYRDALRRYVTKYFGKANDHQHASQAWGRWWGVVGRQHVPWSLVQDVTVPARVAARMVRYMRRALRWPRADGGIFRIPSRDYKALGLIGDPSTWGRLLAFELAEHAAAQA